MSKMTYKQVDHARLRIAQIRTDALGPRPTTPESYNVDKLATAILDDGLLVSDEAFKLAATAQFRSGPGYNYSSTKFVDVLVKAVFAEEIAVNKEVYEELTATYDARKVIFDEEAQAVEDAIVLGDCIEALRLLAGLADYSV